MRVRRDKAAEQGPIYNRNGMLCANKRANRQILQGTLAELAASSTQSSGL